MDSTLVRVRKCPPTQGNFVFHLVFLLLNVKSFVSSVVFLGVPLLLLVKSYRRPWIVFSWTVGGRVLPRSFCLSPI